MGLNGLNRLLGTVPTEWPRSHARGPADAVPLFSTPADRAAVAAAEERSRACIRKASTSAFVAVSRGCKLSADRIVDKAELTSPRRQCSAAVVRRSASCRASASGGSGGAAGSGTGTGAETTGVGCSGNAGGAEAGAA